jgi:6-phosphogluconolactonase
MSTSSVRNFTQLFVFAALSFALTSCGATTPVICALPVSSSSGTCTCGSGMSACPLQPGPEFLYATSIGGQILAFSIDQNNNGALTAIGSVSGPSSLSPGLTSVSNQFLYASDRQNSQIDGFSINQTTGALTALAGSPFFTGTLSFPGALASPPASLGLPASNLLYAADSGTVDTFTISAAGVPTALSGSPFVPEAGFSIVVDPSGSFLYASDDDLPGGIFAFTDSAGVLTAVPDSPFTIPGQTVVDSLPTGIVDTGSYVYAALSQANQIAAFSIVSGTGALTPVPDSPFAAGTVPTAVVLAGNFLYAINSSDGTISGYSINSTSGVLTPLSGSPFAIAGFSLATDYFGQHLYVAGATGIQAFSVDFTSGGLTPVSGSPFPAIGPSLLTVVQIPPL